MNRQQKYSYSWIVEPQKMNRMQDEFILLNREQAGNEPTAKEFVLLNRRHASNESTAKVFILLNHKTTGNESTAKSIHVAGSYARRK